MYEIDLNAFFFVDIPSSQHLFYKLERPAFVNSFIW